MKLNTMLFILIFVWLAILTRAAVFSINTNAYILGELGGIWNMFTDVYEHITNLLTMGVRL